MFINTANYDDIVKYYKKTYVKFKEEGETIWFIQDVFPDRMVVTNIQGEEAAINLQTGYQLDYLIPKKTTYQYGENAVMLSRIPARMWRKGMDSKNTKFVVLGSEGQWGNMPFDIRIIEGFVNKPSYFTVEQGLAEFARETGLQSIALSPRMSMSLKGAVFVDDVMVARYTVNSKGDKQLSYKKIFKEELMSLFFGLNIKFKEI